jgi:hypothetical protein
MPAPSIDKRQYHTAKVNAYAIYRQPLALMFQKVHARAIY